MADPTNSIAELLRRDRRYHFDAYIFVFESLRYAQEVLGWGKERPSTEGPSHKARETAGAPKQEDEQGEDVKQEDAEDEGSEHGERHLTGQELCEAIRLFALDQYGYMAKSVLNHWGVTTTGDFGEIVFNLIEVGQMHKTAHDRREDFNAVFKFDQGLQENFKITPPEQKWA